MKLSRRMIAAGLLVAGLALWLGLRGAWAKPPSFDKLSSEDRQVFQQRFEKEIWPLLERNGKDGCVGCHNGKRGTPLKFSGSPGKDFTKLLSDGFFLPDDPGSLLGRIIEKDEKRRMPPENRKAWTEKEIQTLRIFVADVDKKQKR